MNLTTHPFFDLTIKQLLNERKAILRHNERVTAKGFKFKATFKPINTKGIDRFIEAKKMDGVQMEIEL